MKFSEMNLAVFEGKPIPHVFFQPRFEPWYAWHTTFNKMPKRYEGMSLLDMYDYVDASPRTMSYYSGIREPIERRFDPQVKVTHSRNGNSRYVVFDTPHGQLVEEHEYTRDHTWREVQFAIKSLDDLKAFTWLMNHMHYIFNVDTYKQGLAWMGDRGIPQFWVPKSPYQSLLQTWWKMVDLVYALTDAPDKVEEAMVAIDRSYDSLYEELCNRGCVKILNFGENLHEQLISPQIFEKYYLPFYEKRCAQLRRAGIFTHIHVDGYFKNMLPWLKYFPHDGIEALTPVPQGDMTLEQIKEHIGNKVLLDGIPAVFFLEDLYSREDLMACVEKIVKLFHPRLVLGVSDEVPEGAGEEAIERVKMVAKWCRNYRCVPSTTTGV